MRYSTEPKDSIYVKEYGLLSFAKNMVKNLSNKYGQKLLDTAKKSTTDAIKTASKKEIQKTAEATGNLIGNKIADKITNISKKSSKELQNNEANDESETSKKRYILPEKKTTNYWWIKANIMMEYKKIMNFLDNASDQSSKFKTKNLVEINDDSRRTYNTNKQIKFKTTMLKSILCDYSMLTYLLKEQ